jgi:hypothetical protein
MSRDTAIEAAKAAPPVGVTGLTIFGVSLSEVVLVLTLMYTIILIIDKLPVLVERIRQFTTWAKGLYDRKR